MDERDPDAAPDPAPESGAAPDAPSDRSPVARDRSRADRTLLVILAAVAALVAVALVVVFTRGEPEQLDEATPEGVVQRYTAAVIAGDEGEAMGYLVPDVAEDCIRIETAPSDRMRVTLASTTERDDSADVDVLISWSYDEGPLGGSGVEEEGTFDLVRTDDGWRIETAPWPLTICEPGAWR
ncbi:hypothetical protein [Agromyces arachidis]|uniref:hypothetical protein n=1 Tax=Agromyces arachidis TaxID=766966 RepID=UPI0040573D03